MNMLPDDILNIILDHMGDHISYWERRGMPGYPTTSYGLLRAQRRNIFSSFTLTCQAWADIGQPRFHVTVHIFNLSSLRFASSMISRKPLLVARTAEVMLGPFGTSSAGQENTSADNLCAMDILDSPEFAQMLVHLRSLKSIHIMNIPFNRADENLNDRLYPALRRLSRRIDTVRLRDMDISDETLTALVSSLFRLENLAFSDCLMDKPASSAAGNPSRFWSSNIRILTLSGRGLDHESVSLTELSDLVFSSRIETLNLVRPHRLIMGSDFIHHVASTLTSLTVTFAFRLYSGTTYVSPDYPPSMPHLRYLHFGGISAETLDWTMQAIMILAGSCQPGALHLKLEVQCDSDAQHTPELQACAHVDRNVRALQYVEIIMFRVFIDDKAIRESIRVMMPECHRRGILSVQTWLESYR